VATSSAPGSERFWSRLPLKRTLNLCWSEFPLLQFIHGAGTAALGWCLPAAHFWTAVCIVSTVSVNLGIGFCGLKHVTQGKRMKLRKAAKHAVFR
jgi:hypothetical protein